jgi:hypothetical protein
VCSKTKAVLIVFFYKYYEDVLHHEYAPHGQTLNNRFCLQALRCLYDAVCHEHLRKRESGNVEIHHDSALSCLAHFVL